MKPIVILFLAVAAVFLIFLLMRVWRDTRRKALMSQRLTESQRTGLISDFPTFARLPDDLRNELEGLVHIFLAEKSFEACGELTEVTEHMQIVIAAEACLLLMNRKHNYYRKLRSILVYPSAYTAKNSEGGTDVRLGESWDSGSVVLAWDSVVSGGKNEEDGSHVAIHEFAHQLDQDDGAGDGVPPLTGGRGSYRDWSQTFSKAFEKFLRKLEKGQKTVIDPYGGTNPAEFFAVATETFYEKPKQLHKHYPEVYEQLRQYYNVDPLQWG